MSGTPSRHANPNKNRTPRHRAREFALHLGEPGANLFLRGLGRQDRCAPLGQECLQLRQPVLGLKCSGFSGPFAPRDESVPAAQVPGLCHQPFAGDERLTFVGIDDANQGEAR